MINTPQKYFLKRLIPVILVGILFMEEPIVYVNADTQHINQEKKNEHGNLELVNALEVYNVNTEDLLERMHDREPDLNTLIYTNQTGEEVAFIFQEEVKYIDENGLIQDKSNELSFNIDNRMYEENYICVNDKNDINTFFPNELTKETGVVIDHKNIQLELSPIVEAEYVYTENNTLTYEGEKISYEYQPTFGGFKENIVISDNLQNEFLFHLDTNGGELFAEANALYVKKNDIIVAAIDPIYIFDSYDGELIDGEIHYSYNNHLEYSLENDGTYLVKIVVDKAFLDSPSTVYPVNIDPSVTIYSSGTGSSKSILDTPIYNGSNVRAITSGANTTGVLGYVDKNYGSGRMLMCFPGLAKQPFMNSKYTISSAKLTLSDESGKSNNAYVNAYYYTGPSWNEKSVYSDAIWNGVGTTIATSSFSSPSLTIREFNILSAVKKWQSNNSEAYKGIVLKNVTSETNSTYYKCICTSESGKKPYLTIKYFYNGVRGTYSIPETTDMNLNCMCYAFFLSTPDFFNELTLEEQNICKNSSVSEALKITKTNLEQWMTRKFGKNKWRQVSSYDDYLAEDEWLVCMRVGVKNKQYDYHFWYRAQDGAWYNKHGWYKASEKITGVINPSTANSCSGWDLGSIKGFYSSDTIYYAIKK